MHLCIMLYTYWTPLGPKNVLNTAHPYDYVRKTITFLPTVAPSKLYAWANNYGRHNFKRMS